MANETTPIPTDLFSRELRGLRDNQSALSASSTIDTMDFYGNHATWHVTTFREEGGDERVFIQRNDAEGGERWVIPPTVAAALARHRDQLSSKVKRRQGHRLIALRRSRGDVLGNPEALRAAKGKQAARNLGLPDSAGKARKRG